MNTCPRKASPSGAFSYWKKPDPVVYCVYQKQRGVLHMIFDENRLKDPGFFRIPIHAEGDRDIGKSLQVKP